MEVHGQRMEIGGKVFFFFCNLLIFILILQSTLIVKKEKQTYKYTNIQNKKLFCFICLFVCFSFLH